MTPGPPTISSPTDEELAVINAEHPDEKMIVCPVNGYNVCPGGVPSVPPAPEDVTSNPLGTCRCNGEVWLSEGCTYAFVCDSGMDIGGTYFSCPSVSVNNEKTGRIYFLITFQSF